MTLDGIDGRLGIVGVTARKKYQLEMLH
jgi:hypothetical protein